MAGRQKDRLLAACSSSFYYMHNPALNPAVRLSPVENGYLAYDPTADRLHELNPVAALIVELCDGAKTVEEVRHLMTPVLPEAAGEEVDRWIAEGIQAGLLTWTNSHTAAPEQLSAQELTKLAKRLRARGNIQTAYVCQRRATELLPNDPHAWSELGELAHILGRRDQTRAAYEKYLDLVPNDEETKHLLVALRDQHLRHGRRMNVSSSFTRDSRLSTNLMFAKSCITKRRSAFTI